MAMYTLRKCIVALYNCASHHNCAAYGSPDGRQNRHLQLSNSYMASGNYLVALIAKLANVGGV